VKASFTPQELTQMSANELIDKMAKGEASIVGAFKRKKLLRELCLGKAGAKFIIWLSQLRTKNSDGATKRQALCETLKKVAPYEKSSNILEGLDGFGAIFAFNHPSLGEILRLIEYCSDLFPKKQLLFPVTVAWFETLAPKFNFLKSIGITITPTITPTAFEEILNGNDEYKDDLDRLTKKLSAYYLELVKETLEKNGIVLVAPSATRKQFLFESEAQKDGLEPIEPQTLSFIVTQLRNLSPGLDYVLYPICVIPPEFYSTGLNLFEKYTLEACSYLNSCEAESMAKTRVEPRPPFLLNDDKRSKRNKAPRKLEYWFLQTMAEVFDEYDRSQYIVKAYVPDVIDKWED